MSLAAVPRSTRSIQLRTDALTPVAACLRLGDRLAFLLESVEGGARYGRYSMVGVRGRVLSVRGDAAVLTDGQGNAERFSARDPLEALRAVLPKLDEPDPGPLPLASGVGYLAYEVAARWERLPVPEADPVGLPDAFFHLPEVVIVFDHLTQSARLVTLDDERADDRLAEVGERLAAAVAAERPTSLPQRRPVAAADDPVSRERYQAGAARLAEEIHAGEMLQAVLARRFTVPARRSPFEIYRSLRRINPSPHLFYLDLDGPVLLGASPELLVGVRGGQVVIRPIAGTRPRSEDPVRDAELEAELAADEKELAEHAMLVDLGRNDVGRVARTGSVRVPVLRAVERYSHVMHLVSEVRGELADGLDAFDAVRSAFPAGTLTGAPKVRAMQSIAELEQERRGTYGGAVGFFSPTDVEAAITIRSAVVRDGLAHVHAGAGIVADSDPEREAAETWSKAAALMAALAEGPAEGPDEAP
ncbi:MAG: chorismate-binding protein [Chloroflexi bacterium]|nr:chorismate-binding protein [Chloroflexota bacterium]